VRVGEGQPEAASIEPSPLEVAEQHRGERDDQIRESMAAQAVEGRSEGLELPVGSPRPEGWDGALKLYRLLAGHCAYSQSAVETLKNEVAAQRVPFVEEVDAGFIFIARSLMVQAPKGCKLQLYENAITPMGFREVVANVQEFSGELPGTCVFIGPCWIVGNVLECKEAGQITIRVEGDLVPREYVPQGMLDLGG
jgi:hypothetical protein